MEIEGEFIMFDFAVPLIGFVVIWALFRGIVYIWKRTFSIKHEIIHGLFAFSLAFIYSVTIFPFPFYAYPHLQGETYVGINLIPFASIRQSLHHFYWLVPVRNIGGNIALFIPFGFFCFLLLCCRFPTAASRCSISSKPAFLPSGSFGRSDSSPSAFTYYGPNGGSWR